MLITKYGHCCLRVRRDPDMGCVLTDPGNYSEGQKASNIDAIVITHEHEDHCHIKSIQEVLKYNPGARIITNVSVKRKLDAYKILCEVLKDGDHTMVNDIYIQAFDAKHAEIYEDMNQVQNTAFAIGELLLPGDSYYEPSHQVGVLALPVAGPWCKISDAVRYALKLKPKMALPIHDGVLDRQRIGAAFRIPEQVLKDHGIAFNTMTDSQQHRKEYMFIDGIIEPYRKGSKGPW